MKAFGIDLVNYRNGLDSIVLIVATTMEIRCNLI